jgi:hypothetical protein
VILRVLQLFHGARLTICARRSLERRTRQLGAKRTRLPSVEYNRGRGSEPAAHHFACPTKPTLGMAGTSDRGPLAREDPVLSSQSLKLRHSRTRILAILLAMAGCSGNDPTAPAIPVPATPSELTGAWNFSDSVVATTAVEQTVCRNRGVATFTAGTASTGADVRRGGTCVSPRGLGGATSTREGSGVSSVGDSIAFAVTGGFGYSARPAYLGRLTGGAP